MATEITLKYCGMVGTGPTVKAAKADAARKIEKLLDGNWQPKLIGWRGKRVLLYRTPDGWHSNKLHADAARLSWSSAGDFADVERSAYYNLLQDEWVPADGVEPPEVMLILWGKESRRLAAEFRSWATFQLRYRVARRRGFSDHECHNIGCGCLGRPDLVAVAKEIETEVEAAIAAGPAVLATF